MMSRLTFLRMGDVARATTALSRRSIGALVYDGQRVVGPARAGGRSSTAIHRVSRIPSLPTSWG
jgi:hypothetical protein